MSSLVSLPKHTFFLGRLSPLSGWPVLGNILSPETDKNVHKYLLTDWRTKSAQEKVWLGKLTSSVIKVQTNQLLMIDFLFCSYIEEFREFFLKMKFEIDVSPHGSPQVSQIKTAQPSSATRRSKRLNTVDCFQVR